MILRALFYLTLKCFGSSIGLTRSVSTMMKTRSCSSPRNEGVKLEQILPLDLVIEILLKLPAKSIARFRCVSKVWDSTFRSPNFTESFFTISWSRPKLLIACQLDGKTFFFSSSPQPQRWCPTTITANFRMSFPTNCPSDIYRPVRGLVCGNTQWAFRAREGSVQLILNPSTGQFLTLPKVRKAQNVVMKSWLGYDPIDKQLKVLCMTKFLSIPYIKHQVLTLGTGKRLSWRRIKCDTSYFPAVMEKDRTDCLNVSDGICINGVLYWVVMNLYDRFLDIVCFDIKSETFSYIKKAQVMEGEAIELALVNYKGKLAMLQPLFSNKDLYTGIKLWVLEDAKKHQWLRCTYVLPSPWLSEYARTKLSFAGMTSTGEIVFSPNYITDSFFLVYYNPERDTITRAGIQGMEAYRTAKAYVFLDHVEDVKLMTSF